jgi:hypothetical protein
MLLERKRTTAAFDRLVDEAYSLLRKPHVAQTLGHAATTALYARLDDLFLPNYRHGKISLPSSELGSTRTPLVPITRRQAQNMGEFIAPLFDKFVIAHQTERLSSTFYGIDDSMEARELLAKYPSQNNTLPTPKFPPVKLRAAVDGAQRSLWVSTNNGQTTLLSRSAVLVRLAETRRTYSGGFLLHELIHVDDIQRDGPVLYSTDTYGITTESRAYQASALGEHPLSVEIEKVRQQNADPSRPFAPTPELAKIIPAASPA